MPKQINTHQLVSLIIVSYNTQEITTRCIKSVIDDIQSSKKLHDEAEIIIIDNNSEDNSVGLIKQQLKKIGVSRRFTYKIIVNKINLGFAKANNQAAKIASGKYLLFLNSDTIVKPGFIANLINILESNEASNHDARLLAGALHSVNGSYQNQGGDLPDVFSLFCQWSGLDDLPFVGQFFPSVQKKLASSERILSKNQLIVRGWVAATALLIANNDFRRLDGFDEKIFMYGEDLELCLRAAKLGWRSAIATQAHVTHLGSASSSSDTARLGEVTSLLYIFHKHYSKQQTALMTTILKLGCWWRFLIFKILNRQKAAVFYKYLASQII